MSISQELLELKKQRDELEEQFERTNKKYNELINQRSWLVANFEAMNSRTSKLAKNLYAKFGKELEEVNNALALAEKECIEVKDNLAKVNKKICAEEADYKHDINEQASNIVSEFLKYVQEHLEEIGSALSCQRYSINIETIVEKGCYRHTGRCGILDIPKNTFIAISKDYELVSRLYVTVYNGDKKDKVLTDFAREYLGTFETAIAENLKKKFNLNDSFELTIYRNHIILDLV